MMIPRKRQRPNPAEASSISLPTTALSRETATSLSQSLSMHAPSPAAKAPQPDHPDHPRRPRQPAASEAEAASTRLNVLVGPQLLPSLPPPIPPMPPSQSTHPHGAPPTHPLAQKQVRIMQHSNCIKKVQKKGNSRHVVTDPQGKELVRPMAQNTKESHRLDFGCT